MSETAVKKWTLDNDALPTMQLWRSLCDSGHRPFVNVYGTLAEAREVEYLLNRGDQMLKALMRIADGHDGSVVKFARDVLCDLEPHRQGGDRDEQRLAALSSGEPPEQVDDAEIRALQVEASPSSVLSVEEFTYEDVVKLKSENAALREKFAHFARRIVDGGKLLSEKDARIAELEADLKQHRQEREAIKGYLNIPDSLEALCCVERCVYSGNTEAERLLDGPPSTLRKRIAEMEKHQEYLNNLNKNQAKTVRTQDEELARLRECVWTHEKVVEFENRIRADERERCKAAAMEPWAGCIAECIPSWITEARQRIDALPPLPAAEPEKAKGTKFTSPNSTYVPRDGELGLGIVEPIDETLSGAVKVEDSEPVKPLPKINNCVFNIAPHRPEILVHMPPGSKFEMFGCEANGYIKFIDESLKPYAQLVREKHEEMVKEVAETAHGETGEEHRPMLIEKLTGLLLNDASPSAILTSLLTELRRLGLLREGV